MVWFDFHSYFIKDILLYAEEQTLIYIDFAFSVFIDRQTARGAGINLPLPLWMWV